MKRIGFIALIVAWSAMIVTHGSADEGGSRKAGAEKKRGGNYSGVVARVDLEAKTITVKSGGKVVTFDASNPTFKGYGGLENIKTGNYAAVSYTAGGVRIAKSAKISGESGVIREKPVIAKKGADKRQRIREKGSGFFDVDENKDGKVTPVELSAVVKDLTMKQFKEYDRDGDGSLSQSEFRSVRAER